MQDVAGKIAAFFKDFSQVEVEVIDVQLGPNGANALCRLPDGEYQVILGSDFSVKAYYRKKPYIKDVVKLPSEPLKPENLSSGNGREASNSKQETEMPAASNSEKAVACGRISQIFDPIYKILSPIIKKLASKG
ncbi:hypothetical protein SAMN05660826_01096 [Caldanaerovirga acetigignens]|uniref:Uncharacterized protein n=1 Tax=Caldanaerovirga acetigignens TaxID=447595 RepID=A0A1M7IZ07_9FIRM|nr:hypothetical protein [Caldanaerovirga acetigignens]SHM46010.1 hypothetical protein SAMN05660826_01096 [Caldanaerovirga acetigignens]